MANVFVEEADLYAIANSIRGKNGLSTTYLPSAMPAAIDAIEGGGGTNYDDFLNKALVSIDSDASNVGDYALYKFSLLESVNLPFAESIGMSACYRCTKLTEINAPNVETILSSAFDGDMRLANINMPMVTSIGNYAFRSNQDVIEFNFPEALTIGSSAFESTLCTQINLPKITSIANYAFRYSTQVENINVDSLITLGNGGFYQCSKLTYLNFNALSSVPDSAFRACTLLTTIVIRTEVLCPLANINAFTSSAVLNGTGFVYVPSVLVDSYKAATNWITFASQIRAIEDYPEITGG